MDSSDNQILLNDRWRPGPPPRLLACRCAAGSEAAGCDEVFFPPRPLCPACWGPTKIVELPTDGTLYTFTTVQVPSDHAEPPYRLGYADLGRVRVLGHLVGAPPRIGAPVTVTSITVGAAAGHGGPGLVYAFQVAEH